MERKNDLGLDSDDLESIDMVIEGLMDCIAVMNANEYTEEQFTDLHDALSYGYYAVSGIIYKHGMEAPECDHEEDEDVEE